MRPLFKLGADNSYRALQRLTILTNILIFSVVSMLLALLVPTPPPDSARHAGNPFHALLFINALAAILTLFIAPYLLRTFEQMQMMMTRQNNELRSLHAIDTAISSELKLDAILEVAVRETTLAVDGEVGALWLFDEVRVGSAGAQRLNSVAQAFYNVSPGMQAMLRESIGDDSTAFALRTSGPHRQHDIESRWKIDHAAAALKLRNTITVPIKHLESVLGVMMVGNRGDTLNPLEGFTDEDEDLLLSIATTISVAIQNARLYEQTQRRGEMLRALIARTGDAIATSSDAPKLMQVLADEAARILGCAQVAVYVYDLESGDFQPLTAHSEANPQHAALDLFYRHPIIPTTPLAQFRTILGEDNRAHGSHYVPDVCAALGLTPEQAPYLTSPGFLFALSSREQERLGLLCMLDMQARPHSPDTTAFARALAAQAAVALENAHLSQQTHALLARAQALQTATNQIAAELDVQRVLDGVMDSARRVLDADGYALWDWDAETQSWEIRAAQGALDRSAAPAEIPAETVILNKVLQSSTPEVIVDTAQSYASPSWAMSGEDSEANRIRAMLALPLLYAGQTAGVMALYYRAPHKFLQDEIGLAQSFAYQVANALENARLFSELRDAYAREKRIAETLQRSLLPPIPRRVGLFEFAQKYQAALEESVIGGDFFDLFTLEEDRIGIVMADVSGKGLRAAVQTAMVKYTLRGFAHEQPNQPGQVLARLNDVLCSDVSSLDSFVTLFYGVLNTATGELIYANAGHELPLLCQIASRTTTSLEMADGLALACFPHIAYAECRVRIQSQDYLLLYTDGLSEARDDQGRFMGTEGLEALMPYESASAPAIVETVFERVSEFAGDIRRDDIAILLLRHAGAS